MSDARTEADLVALREENARLSTRVCFLERCLEQTNPECDRLRAHVAALVKVGREMLAALRVPGPMPATIEAKQALMDRGFEQIDAAAVQLRAALDAVEK